MLDEHRRGTEEAIAATGARLREEIRQGFTRWMATGESLSALAQVHWNPALADAATSLADESRARLDRLATGPHAGLTLPPEIVADLQAAAFLPHESGRRAFGSARADAELGAYRMTIPVESVPVRKSFLDWLLFRRRATVRRRVFGADGNRKLTPPEKEKRLRKSGRAEFERLGEAAIHDRIPARPTAFAANLARNYASSTAENIRADLRALRDLLTFHRQERQTPFETNAAILHAADALRSEAGRAARNIEILGENESAAFTSPPPIPPEYAKSEPAGLLPSPFTMLPPLCGC